jgi:hypothetical protein
MEWSWLVPVLIVASVSGSIAFSTWVKARHGYPIEDDNGNHQLPGGIDGHRKIELLTSENEQLHGKIGRLEERIAVLERIVTDAPGRLSAEIENLK